MAYQNYAGAWLRESTQGPQITGWTPYSTVYGPNQNNTWGVSGANSTLVGGAQDDFYWLPDPGYVPVERAGGGVDTVQIWHKYVLPENIENLTVFGNGQYAAGNNGDNIIKATATNNYIYGARGSDVFVGSGGSGTTFVVAAGEGDKVIQNFSFGADTLRLIGGPLTSVDAVKAAMTQRGADVDLNVNGTHVLFRNANVSQFQQHNFELPLNYSSLGSMTFNDEFNSASTIGSTWQSQFREANVTDSYTLPRNGEQQIYTNPNFTGTGSQSLGLNPFAFNNGVMTITARPVSDAQSAQMWGYKYSSGMLQTTTFAQTYGYFEVRADLPEGKGLWPAFWLLGEQNKEIDVLEALGTDPRAPFQALHSPAIGEGYSLENFNPYADGFHNYGVLWDPKDITFFVDGTEVWKTPTPSDMHSPLRMIVNLAVGGHWPGSPDGSTPWPAEMKIDYVRAYNLPGVGSNTAPPPPAPTAPSTGGTSPAPTAPAPAPSDGSGQVLTAASSGAVLTGGAGADTITASQGFDTLTGGGGADRFVLAKEPWAPIQITDFQLGSDVLDLSALFRASGYAGADPVADRYIRLESNGAGGTLVRFDRDGAGSGQPWPNTIVDLKGIAPTTAWAQLSGGAAGGGTTAPTAPTAPSAPSSGSGQVLTATASGAVLTGGAGADTLNASQGFDTLTGGAGADRFVFGKEPWAPIQITDFQIGSDALDLSALFRASGYTGSNPIADRFIYLESNGAGGTIIRYDRDGSGGNPQWPNTIIELKGVAPGGLTWGQLSGGAAPSVGGSTPIASSGGQKLTASGPHAVLTGGAGADTLVASQGYDTLTGGAGADHFVLTKEPWAPIKVADFQAGEDKLDFRALFDASGYTGSNPIGDRYMYVESDGADGALIRFDRDAWGSNPVWPNTIVHLEHLAPAKVAVSDWIVQ